MDCREDSRPRTLQALSVASMGLRRIRAAWKEFWSWRRIRFSRGGAAFTGGAFAIGFAAINTGNNLLYLLLGAMLGFIAVSSWLSEQVIGAITVQRRLPRGVTVGNPVRILYELKNERKRVPAFALEVGEEELPGRAFVPLLNAGEATLARSENRFVRRGVFPLEEITVSTSFPFGLFRKTRTLRSGGELVVWPRTDRRVFGVNPGGGRDAAGASPAPGGAGPRGEYRGLRSYRPGDDPRDIHWRTTARLGMPVVREYEQNVAETVWICLDTRGEGGDVAEAAVETAAALAARAFQAGNRFAFAGGGFTVEPGHGSAHLEAVLDALARVEFRAGEAPVLPPVSPRQCILVTSFNRSAGDFGRVISAAASPSGARAQGHPGGPPSGSWTEERGRDTDPGARRRAFPQASEEGAG